MSTLTTSRARRAAIMGDATPASGSTDARSAGARSVEPAPVPHGGFVSTVGEVVRPFMRRWVTTAMLLAGAMLATLYISNAIAVNDLLVTITSLERERDGVRTDNEHLRSELVRLLSVDRVASVASTRLGLVQPAVPPQDLTAPMVAATAPAADTSVAGTLH